MVAILQVRELTPDLAARFANITLGHVAREYPYADMHIVTGPDDIASPSARHPIFYGSFDWHSCVHGHWLLARLLRLFPDLPNAEAIRAHFGQAFTQEKVAGELAYLNRPSSAGFERPYGWAWLLKLASELRDGDWPPSHALNQAIQPLAGEVTRRLLGFLPRADYPVRAGVHSNTAFALILSHDYAIAAGDEDLAATIVGKARDWYAADEDCQAWEPSGDDFLSPALVEVELMRRILDPGAFRAWFAGFLPRACQGEPATLYSPVRVSDRGDGKIAHLDGLNLSRAWCWRAIAAAHGHDSAVGSRAAAAAQVHLEATLPHLSADYMGEHWLASFALLALTEG
ncbi:MAG TPA: DUF2891 domain-containing protein [Caulobacteraceae bacterium]